MKLKYILIVIVVAGLAWWFLVNYNGKPAVAPEAVIPTPAPIVGENPEGEADPYRMTLDMKTWNWISISYKNGTEITPKVPSKFTLTFKKDGTFSATTDCNGIGGNYEVDGPQVLFSKMMSTMMYCEGSQEGDLRKILEDTRSFFFTSEGKLFLDMKDLSGTATFR